jgi:hypothetical protein
MEREACVRAFGRAIALTVILVALCAPLAAQTNPIPFISNPLVPSVKAPGGPGFMLTVNGAGFVQGYIVKWNGTARVTTFVSPTNLTAAILASDISTAGTVLVTVSNPVPGGGTSNAAFFEITAPTTTLSFTRNDVGGSMIINQPIGMTVGDFNRDGITDLAVANHLCPASQGCLPQHSDIAILLGGGFSVSAEPLTGNPLGLITSGDFNGDGILDLITMNGATISTGPTISVLLGNGDGTFQAHTDLPIPGGVEPGSVATGDFNRDGHVDLAVTASSNVSLLLGNGDGTFGTPISYNTGLSPAFVAVGDFNGDGKLDLAVSDPIASKVSILLGNGDGTFLPPVDYSTDLSPESVVIADFDGDGKPDFAVANATTVSIFLGNGDGTFRPKVDYPAGAAITSLTTGDYNGDGILDLAVSDSFCRAKSCGSVNVLLGKGDGTFQSHVDLAAGNGAGSTATLGQGIAALNYQDDTISIFTPISTGPVNPLPTISSISPLSVQVGSGVFMLTVNGTNFVNGAEVLFGATTKPTMFVSSTQLTAQIFAADVATAGTFWVSVVNPAPGGGSSTTIPFNVFLPPPAITSLIPPSVVAGGPAFTLTVNGLYFVSAAVVNVNGLPRTPAFVSSTQVTIPIAGSEIANQGTISISVSDPAGGGSAGGTSSAVTLTILPTNTQPVIGALHPASATAGGPGFTLQIVGTGFTVSSAVTFNSISVSTAFVNATLLQAAIPASAIAVAGTPFVTVANPGGSPSVVATFTVNEDFKLSVPVPSISVVAGQLAKFDLMVVPANTTTANAVSLTASGLPMGATPSFSPSTSIPAGSGASTVTLSIATMAHSTLPPFKSPHTPSSHWPVMYMVGLVIVLAWFSLRVFSRPVPRFTATLSIVSLLVIAAGMIACGGVIGPAAPSVNPGMGTPAGTYPIVVTATSGNGSLSTTLTLTVM